MVSQESSKIDAHLTQVLKHVESFKEAFLKKDYVACTELWSQVNEILIEKTSKGGTELAKTLDVTEDKEHTEKSEEQKYTEESAEKDQELEDFKNIPMDRKFTEAYPYVYISPVKSKRRTEDKDMVHDTLCKEKNENLEEDKHDEEKNKRRKNLTEDKDMVHDTLSKEKKENLEEDKNDEEKLGGDHEENEEPVRRSRRISNPSVRKLCSLEQLDSEDEEDK